MLEQFSLRAVVLLRWLTFLLELALLNIHSADEVLSHPVAGASWEGYVLEQIAALKNPELQLYFYRTHDGAECDAVLVKGIKPVACI